MSKPNGLILLFLVLWILPGLAAGEEVSISFSLSLDRKVYDYTDYGEPPQVAIWLEQKEQKGTGKIKTVFVTHRTAKGEWVGKVGCPVSLPYWVSRYNIETGAKGAPTFKTPLPDGVSGATPKKELKVTAQVPKGGEWYYFIEVNVSGDYNRYFPSMTDDGVPDSQGNGQPSLIYKGEIKATLGQTSIPKLIGRTLQMDATSKIITDLTSITTARNLFLKLQVYIPQ
jgi:hypothetical protein